MPDFSAPDFFVGRITADQIAALYHQRVDAAGPMRAMQREVQAMYNADIVVPLAELNQHEKAPLPNRVQTGLQQISNRVVSQLPNLHYPPVRTGFETSEKRARDRRRANLGWWANSNMKKVLRQRSRYYLGYSQSPVEIRWDHAKQMPRWEPLNPLVTYPSPFSSVTDLVPRDCIFEMVQTLGWLQENFPVQANIISKGGKSPRRDMEFTLLKYVDEFEIVLVALGQPASAHDRFASDPLPGSMTVELTRHPNRAGITPVVVPRLITLDRPHGQFNGLLGMYQAEAMLMALSIHATRKGVFTEEWLVARPGEEPILEQVPNPAMGIPGVVKGADIQPRGVDPQFQTNITMDRLAEAQRMSAGLTPELSGVAGTNIRTGRRASQLLSAAIDFTIQEAQEDFESSLTAENKIAVAFCRGYSDGKPKSFYVSWKGEKKGQVTYTPETTFETDENVVSYAMTGTDLDGLVISAGQRIGMGTLSKRKFMELDPLIEDAEEEIDRVRMEQIELAFWSSVQTLAANPEGPWQPADFATLNKLIVTNKMEPYDAVAEVQRLAQERQAAQVEATAPEAQPGLSLPGQGQEVQAIGETEPSLQNLNQLLFNLRAPQGGI